MLRNRIVKLEAPFKDRRHLYNDVIVNFVDIKKKIVKSKVIKLGSNHVKK